MVSGQNHAASAVVISAPVSRQPCARRGVATSHSVQPPSFCRIDCNSRVASSELVVVIRLLSPAAGRLLLLAVIHAVGLALLGRVGNLGHDVVEEVELLVLGDGLLEVDGADALRVALLGFGGGFGDQGDHEQLEGFCCAVG